MCVEVRRIGACATARACGVVWTMWFCIMHRCNGVVRRVFKVHAGMQHLHAG